MWLQDTGILKKLKDDELRAPIPIPLPKVKLNQPLSISQLAMAFFLAATGAVISISAFLVELLKGQKGKTKGAKPRRVGWGTPPKRLTEKKLRKDQGPRQNIRLTEGQGPSPSRWNHAALTTYV